MGRVQAAIVIGATVFLALVVVLYVHSGTRSQAGESLPRGAPGFELPRRDGTRLSLASERGKTVLLNFWATWCPPCVDETPSLVDLANRLGPRGLVVVGISADEDAAAVDGFVARFGVRYEVLMDPAAAVAHRYGTFKYPESYVIDPAGQIVKRYVGPVDWSDADVVRELEGLLVRSGSGALN